MEFEARKQKLDSYMKDSPTKVVNLGIFDGEPVWWNPQTSTAHFKGVSYMSIMMTGNSAVKIRDKAFAFGCITDAELHEWVPTETLRPKMTHVIHQTIGIPQLIEFHQRGITRHVLEQAFRAYTHNEPPESLFDLWTEVLGFHEGEVEAVARLSHDKEILAQPDGPTRWNEFYEQQ